MKFFFILVHLVFYSNPDTKSWTGGILIDLWLQIKLFSKYFMFLGNKSIISQFCVFELFLAMIFHGYEWYRKGILHTSQVPLFKIWWCYFLVRSIYYYTLTKIPISQCGKHINKSGKMLTSNAKARKQILGSQKFTSTIFYNPKVPF